MDRYRQLAEEIRAATYHLLAEQGAGLTPGEKVSTALCVAAIALFEAVKGLPPGGRAAALDRLLADHACVLGRFDRGQL